MKRKQQKKLVPVLHRLMDLDFWLSSPKLYLDLDRMAERYDMEKLTIYRDIELFRALGLKIIRFKRGGRFIYRYAGEPARLACLFSVNRNKERRSKEYPRRAISRAPHR